jgi:hypothetical protein
VGSVVKGGKEVRGARQHLNPEGSTSCGLTCVLCPTMSQFSLRLAHTSTLEAGAGERQVADD